MGRRSALPFYVLVHEHKMKTTKEQRGAWRAEYASKEECPGCSGKLPVHQAVISLHGGLSGLTWSGTRFGSFHEHGPAEPNAWGEAADMLEGLLVEKK